MLEVLLDLVKDHAQDAVVNNTDIPNDHNDATISATAYGILNFLKEKAQSGDMTDLLAMVQSAGANPSQSNILSQLNSGNMLQGLVGRVAKEIAEKVGIPESVASAAASKMIPNIFSQFVKKVADPQDSSLSIDSVAKAIGLPASITSMLGLLGGMGGTAKEGAADSSGFGGMLSALGGLMKS